MTEKKQIRLNFAERAVLLADIMADVPPIFFLLNEDGRRETPEFHPLSGRAGRMAVLSLTFCNPLSLQAATVIEGGMK